MATLPKPVCEILRATRNRLLSMRNARRKPAEIFSEIYARNLWGDELSEAFSGPGSRGALAEDYTSFVADYVIRHRIVHILDVGVGDFHVARALLDKLATLGWSGTYTGCDVVRPLIEKHQARHAANNIAFLHLDAISEPLPKADLCLARQVLQHLSNDAAGKVLAKIDIYPHAIISEHHPAPQFLTKANADKVTGGDVRVTQGSGLFPHFPPFNFSYRIELRLPIRNGVVVNSEEDATRQEHLAIMVKCSTRPAAAARPHLFTNNAVTA